MTAKIPKLDLAFAISALPSDNNFALILDVVKEVTERFFSDRVKYGLIVFGRAASIRIHFRDGFTDPKNLERLIGLIAGNNDEPALDQALVLAKRLFESEAARKDAQKVCGQLNENGLLFFVGLHNKLSCGPFSPPHVTLISIFVINGGRDFMPSNSVCCHTLGRYDDTCNL